MKSLTDMTCAKDNGIECYPLELPLEVWHLILMQMPVSALKESAIAILSEKKHS